MLGCLCVFASAEDCVSLYVLCILVCIMFKLLTSAFIHVNGAVCPLLCVVVFVASYFAGRIRDGDVTIWYQSSRLQQWASMGNEGCSDRR